MLKRIIFGIITFVYLSISVNANFEIAEVFPNTVDDSNLEYITIKNNYEETKSLSGFILEDTSGKQFTFGQDDIIEPGERKKFLRTYTKIILNNTNETVFLYDEIYELVDSIYYENSQKGEFLSFEEISLEPGEGLFSNEAIISDEVKIDESLDGNLEPLLPVELLPQIIVSLQRASYIFETDEQDVYVCDSSKDECKVNFNFEESFTGDFSASDYICSIDFGLGVITEQEEKCNPNTVIFPLGTHRISIKIISSDYPEHFVEKIITIRNSELEEEDLNTISEIKTTDLANDFIITAAPDIKIEFQRPSYIFTSEDDSVFTCNTSKEECKVNFDLGSSFSEGLKEGDFYCENNFGLGELSGEEQKCNPNTIIFPIGTYKIEFKIISKNNPSIFSTRVVTLHNAGYIPHSSISLSDELTGVDKKLLSVSVVIKEIIIQSGVILDGFNIYKCKKISCSMNLNYITQEKYEKCYWDFGEGIASNSSTHTRCNPGLIKYGIGEFKGSLTVYEKGNDSNFKKINFTVLNLETSHEEGTEKYSDDEILAGENQEITVEIELQGKVSKNKTVSGFVLTCFGVEKCNVNLNGLITGSKKGLQYIWYLNDSEFATKLNPAGIWLELGEHNFRLEVIRDGELLKVADFQVSVLNTTPDIGTQGITQKEEKLFYGDSSKVVFLQRDMSGVIFGDILPNPAGKDTLEFIQINNTSLSSKNLEGCYVTDGSKKYIFGSDVLSAGTNKYYFKYQTHITLGNSKDSLELYCGETLLDSVIYDRKMKDNELVSGSIFTGFSLFELKNIIALKELEPVMRQYLNLKFLVLKRDGLKITGNTLPNSKLELFLNGKLIFTLNSDSNGKILVKSKYVSVGNYDFDIKITHKTSEYYLENAGNFEITQAQRYSWFYKKPSKTASSPNPKISQFIISQADAYEPGEGDIVESLSVRQKIFLFISMLGLLLILTFHILSMILPKVVIQNLAELFLLRFSTREKVILILR